ncbi:saccharopine dehydrogenase-like NADP-dependent oxidoreductase [Dyadobacter jejuensis]|uniref:Saccharopine dehydrogenase-like NADP-dependent oxidoreductase n=1 Tax=Dyadobacter jejuensis TaxID=1082580 RepID=A0A316AKD0_9BACT|nr:saccharopine dehydrogenase C-terminal domain-containing protein [Dyadobacter jejuensis]PWJ58235.1 saccharopine dehydrogenase-like NADP-dependent oxidoreductase [Dyadobacter jejuensis]
MKNILVIGLGKVGSLVGTLLAHQFSVLGVDKQEPALSLVFDVALGDITDLKFLSQCMEGKDAVVSCMPYNLNLPIARMAHQKGLHYFDLTEDVATTSAIREMAKTSRGAMVPQCGLAPGFIGIVGTSLANKFTKLRDIELRVGALPRYPNGQMGYSFTWSPAGVVNEYINDAEVIHNGVKKLVPSLEGIEMINIEGQEFEAFSTSGGLGTMCESFEGQVDTLNYKTIRYPGHCRLMRFMLYELLLKNDRALIEKILTEAKPPVQQDVVYVYAVVEGWKDDRLEREEFYQAYHPIEIDGQHWRAISWTTAASIAAAVELVAHGALPGTGFIRQEDIPLEDFLGTKNGQFFKQYID